MSNANLKIVPLPSHFVQVQLNGLKELVDNHRADDCKVQFDAGEVDRVDGAAVQFLMAVNQLQAQADEQSVVVVNANDVLLSAFADMGVADLIGTESAAPAPVGEDHSA